jgi:hypothetical protein
MDVLKDIKTIIKILHIQYFSLDSTRKKTTLQISVFVRG